MKPAAIELVEHPARPMWGRCLVSAERDGKVFLVCEDGEERAIASTHRGQLRALQLDAEAQAEAVLAIETKRAAALGKRIPRGKPRKVAPKTARVTWEQELERFLAAYPGGFTGEKFGAERATRDQAVARAKELFAQGALAGSAAFDQAMTFLAETKLIHPMEGTIALKTMPEDARAGFTSALRDVIHGSGDFAARFDALVGAVKLMKGENEPKRPSWPFVTLFAGYVAPTEQAYIKPKMLLEQAAILGMTVEYDPLPSGKAYEQLLAVLRAVEGKLREAGQSPRDLLDVSQFVITSAAPQAIGAAPQSDD